MVGTLSRFQCGPMVTKESNIRKKIDNATTNVKKKDIVLGDIACEIKNLQEVQTSKLITHILNKFEKKVNRKELKVICGQIDERFRNGRANVLQQSKVNGTNSRKTVSQDYNSTTSVSHVTRSLASPTLQRRSKLSSRKVIVQDSHSPPTCEQISTLMAPSTPQRKVKITTVKRISVGDINSTPSSDNEPTLIAPLTQREKLKGIAGKRTTIQDLPLTNPCGQLPSAVASPTLQRKLKGSKGRKTMVSDPNPTFNGEQVAASKETEGVIKENLVQRRIYQWNNLQEKSYCRLCGKEKESRFFQSLFSEKAKEKDLVSKVIRTCGVDIKENDPLPKVICRICEKFVTKMSEFRKVCQRTQLKFSFKRSVMNAPRLALPPPPSLPKDPAKENRKNIECKELTVKNKRTKQRILIANQNEININVISMVTVDDPTSEAEGTKNIPIQPESVFSIYHDTYVSQTITNEQKAKLTAAVNTDQPSEIAAMIINECPSIIQLIKKRILKDMNKSCQSLCDGVNSSVLYKQSYNGKNDFNIESIYTEIQSIIPFFIDILNAIAGKETDFKQTDTDLRIKYSLIYAILMEIRWHKLSLVSRIIATLLMKGGTDMKFQYDIHQMYACMPHSKRSIIFQLIGGHFMDFKYAQVLRGISNNWVLQTLKGQLKQDNKSEDYHLFSSDQIENRVSFLRISKDNPKADTRLLPRSKSIDCEESQDYDNSTKELVSQICPHIFPKDNFNNIIEERVPLQYKNKTAIQDITMSIMQTMNTNPVDHIKTYENNVPEVHCSLQNPNHQYYPISCETEVSTIKVAHTNVTQNDAIENMQVVRFENEIPKINLETEKELLLDSPKNFDSWSTVRAITSFTKTSLLKHSYNLMYNGCPVTQTCTNSERDNPTPMKGFNSHESCEQMDFNMSVSDEVTKTFYNNNNLNLCIEEGNSTIQVVSNTREKHFVNEIRVSHGSNIEDVKILFVNTEVMITTLDDDGRGKDWIVNRKKSSNTKTTDMLEYLGRKLYYESPNQYQPLYLDEAENDIKEQENGKETYALCNEHKHKNRKNKNRSDGKRYVYIIGDCLLRAIKGIDLKKKLNTIDSVFVRCYPGATTNEMVRYSRPTMKKQPSCVILHCGTNDLQNGTSAKEIAINIVDLASLLKTDCGDIMVSGILPRRDRWDVKRQLVNMEVRNKCSILNIAYRDHHNIDKERDLDKGGVNLNKRGSNRLFQNYIEILQSRRASMI